MDEQQVETRQVNTGKLVGGLIVLGLGTAFLLDQFDVIWVGGIIRFWPLILIGLGISKLTQGRSDRKGGAIWLIAIGCWLLISSLGLFGLSYENSWPLLLVFVGLSMAVQALFFNHNARHATEDRHEQ